MSVEDRLRTALHAEADHTEVAPDSFDRIGRRTASARRRRRMASGGLALVAVVALAVGVPLALEDDGEPVRTGPASDSRETTTTTSTTTTTTEPAPSDPAAEPLFRWPSDGTGYDSPEDLVSAFAEEYLGIARPALEDNGNSTFTVRPRGEGGAPVPVNGPRTVVELGPYGESTVVIGATSPNITVDTPAPGGTASSGIRVSGQARNLFEGNVIVEVRDEAGDLLTATNTTATGSGPDLASFSVDVAFDPPSGRGAVVVKSDSGLEGTPEATVVPVTFGPPTAGTTQVTVYLVNAQEDFVPVTREVPRTTGVLRAALLELLEGATPEEEARGLFSPFDDHADHLRGVTITEDGTAIVDLVPDFGNNSSTSTMSYLIVGSLDRTVFQFPNVVWVAYRFNGECGGTIGEIDPAFFCERRTRDQY